MLRHRAPIPILLLSALVLGCDGQAPWVDEEEPPAGADPADFGPTAAYDRRMIFLGPGGELPTTAVFDFQMLSDSVGVRRGVRARVIDGEDWITLLDAGWEMAPMRQPWRLVPHGSLRLRVNEAGELDAVEVRDDPVVRLEPGVVLAEYEPDAGTQLILREAALALDDETHSGILLDAQLGRAVGSGFLPRARRDTGARADADEAALEDSVPATPSPTARPGTEALLLDGDGFYFVLAGAAGGQITWVHSAGQNDARGGVELRPTATESFPGGAVEVATAWQLVSPAGAVVGELRAEAADRAALDGPGATALGYVVVSGWVEDRSVRREVFGLVRQIL